MFANPNERKVWNRAARSNAVQSLVTAIGFTSPAFVALVVSGFTSHHIPRVALILAGYGAGLGLLFAMVSLGCLVLVALTERD